MNMYDSKRPEVANNVIEIIVNQIDRQCVKGQEKYGETIDEAKGYNWNHMALEELVDGMQYMVKENKEIRNQVAKMKTGIKSIKMSLEVAYNFTNVVGMVQTKLETKDVLKDYREIISLLEGILKL